MRVKDDGKNIRFYSKQGATDTLVSELLMHLDGLVEGKAMTVVMSITGAIDLKQIGKLTQELKVPGSEQLKNTSISKTSVSKVTYHDNYNKVYYWNLSGFTNFFEL